MEQDMGGLHDPETNKMVPKAASPILLYILGIWDATQEKGDPQPPPRAGKGKEKTLS